MRKFFGIVLIGGFLFYVASLIGSTVLPGSASEKGSVGSVILAQFAEETVSANAVTSVVVSYRGFDTLGEVTVLFLSALSLSLLFSGGIHKEKLLGKRNFIFENGLKVVAPFIFLFGAYVVVHGHLSPGGGFPGGVIIATGVFAMLFTGSLHVSKSLFSVIEGLSGLTFVVLGILGLVSGHSFLYNFMPKGTLGSLLSAGIIPVIYAVVGVKVAAELTGLTANSLYYEQED